VDSDEARKPATVAIPETLPTRRRKDSNNGNDTEKWFENEKEINEI